jgi:hypothetical protein
MDSSLVIKEFYIMYFVNFQAKSFLLQKLSTNELMSKFESLTMTNELMEVQVPEFSW